MHLVAAHWDFQHEVQRDFDASEEGCHSAEKKHNKDGGNFRSGLINNMVHS